MVTRPSATVSGEVGKEEAGKLKDLYHEIKQETAQQQLDKLT